MDHFSHVIIHNIMIHITLPDGTIQEFPEKTTPYDIALSISEGLARNVLAAVVDDKTVALNQELTHDAHVRLLTWNDPEGKAVFWHSSAHLMAAAIEELYPGVKFGIGPSIETGFYYDIDFMDYQISSDDFPKIEAKMAEIVGVVCQKRGFQTGSARLLHQKERRVQGGIDPRLGRRYHHLLPERQLYRPVPRTALG